MNILITMTREIYHSYMKDDGTIYKEARGFVATRKLGKEQDDFLRRYIDLIMNTKMVGKATKIYMKSTLPSVASVIKQHNLGVSEVEQINIKTAQSQIYYDTKKLLKYFPKEMLTQITVYKNHDIDQYNKMLNLAISKYKKHNKMLSNIQLKLPNVPIEDSVTDEEWDEFIGMILPYLKSHMEYIQNNLPNRSLGYLYYLTSSSPTLIGKDKERYESIKQKLDETNQY